MFLPNNWIAVLSSVLLMLAVRAQEDVDAGETPLEEAEEIQIDYVTPDIHHAVHFAEHFDDAEVIWKRWIKSSASKETSEGSKFKYEGEWNVEALNTNPLTGDKGLTLKSKAAHSAVAARFKKPFQFDQDSFIVQYEINFQNGQDCGGGYIKLLSQSAGSDDLSKFNDKTPYSIMFGPDKCGSESKLHLIFNHRNPKNQSLEEKHAKKLETKDRALFEEIFKDHRPHLLRLILNPDNTYEMSLDYKVINHGSLLNDFDPPVNPPAEIDDPTDKKPEDWDDRSKIPDPTAKKPDDWDESEPREIADEDATMPEGWLMEEPEMIPDPEATRPNDWDDEMDGEWEAPLVPNPKCKEAPGCGRWVRPMVTNPKYKGKWFTPMIDNPNYKGVWKCRKIPNPDYFYDDSPFRMTPIYAVGIEIWSMSDEIHFDNIIVTNDVGLADEWARATFDLKVQKFESGNANMFQRLLAYSNKNPWLYAVYVVLIGLPLVLIVTFCCSGSGVSKQEGFEDDSARKKDDGDEDEAEGGEEEEEEEESSVITDKAESLENNGENNPRRRRARKEL